MNLSEAIKKREQLLRKAEEMEKWLIEQCFEAKGIKWYAMKKAIQQVIDEAFEEWRKYDEAIEKHINLMEIEIE